MNRLGKVWQWVLSGVIVYTFFRFIESLFVYGVLIRGKPDNISVVTNLAANSFSVYRDFVTVSTGLLALIVGAIGIGSYISFKKFKEEEEKITDRRKQLEMHLKIEEARIVKGSDDLGSMTVVKIYNEAEALYPGYSLLYILRGEEFYLMGKDHYSASKYDFDRALEKDPISSRAWYGLGQTLYKLALKEKEPDTQPDFDWNTIKGNIEANIEGGIKGLELRKIEDEATCNKKIEEAIECMQKASSYGFDEALVKYEIGRMYETINENAKALKSYKEAFDINENNHTTGFYYCSLWVRMNIEQLKENVAKCEEVIGILKEVTYQNLYAGPLAYVLLWFLYAKMSKKEKAEEIFKVIRPYAFKEVFKTTSVT